MGYLFAIITSVFFTAYVVPKKLTDQPPIRYSLFQGMGFFAASALTYLISIFLPAPSDGNIADRIDSPVLLISLAAGVVWFSASMSFLISIDKMGMSRSNQWKNLQGPFGALFNMIFLAEYMHTNVWFIMLASALIMASAMFLNVSDSGAMQKDRSGIFYALLAAILFGLYSLLQKYVTSTGHIYSQLICTAFAVFLSAIIYLLIREKSIGCIKDAFKKKNVMGLLAGILFFGASFFTVQAYKLLPGSVAFTIIQLNSVWTVLVGIIIFREISFSKHWIRIMAGIFAAIGGVIMLLMAQN